MPPDIQDYQKRLANTTIGATTLRKQGAAGVVAAARTFLRAMDLDAMGSLPTADAFAEHLNHQTDDLMKVLPAAGSSFGAARKAINLFLGETYYHRVVCQEFGLERIAPWLEVPLDRMVAEYLHKEAKARSVVLPTWSGIKWLTPEKSQRYQDFAALHAAGRGEGWLRIHVDLVAWGR